MFACFFKQNLLFGVCSESGQSASHDIIVVVSGQFVKVLPDPECRCRYGRWLHGFRDIILRRCRRPARSSQRLHRSQLPGRLPRRLPLSVLRLLVRRGWRRRRLPRLVPESTTVSVPGEYGLPELLLTRGRTPSPSSRRRRCRSSL